MGWNETKSEKRQKREEKKAKGQEKKRRKSWLRWAMSLLRSKNCYGCLDNTGQLGIDPYEGKGSF